MKIITIMHVYSYKSYINCCYYRQGGRKNAGFSQTNTVRWSLPCLSILNITEHVYDTHNYCLHLLGYSGVANSIIDHFFILLIVLLDLCIRIAQIWFLNYFTSLRCRIQADYSFFLFKSGACTFGRPSVYFSILYCYYSNFGMPV